MPVIRDGHRFAVDISHESGILTAVLLVEADQHAAKVGLKKPRHDKDRCESGQSPDRRQGAHNAQDLRNVGFLVDAKGQHGHGSVGRVEDERDLPVVAPSG